MNAGKNSKICIIFIECIQKEKLVTEKYYEELYYLMMTDLRPNGLK